MFYMYNQRTHFDYSNLNVFEQQICSYLSNLFFVAPRANSETTTSILLNCLREYDETADKSNEVKEYLLKRINELRSDSEKNNMNSIIARNNFS